VYSKKKKSASPPAHLQPLECVASSVVGSADCCQISPLFSFVVALRYLLVPVPRAVAGQAVAFLAGYFARGPVLALILLTAAPVLRGSNLALLPRLLQQSTTSGVRQPRTRNPAWSLASFPQQRS
jgi:hypothetical protein